MIITTRSTAVELREGVRIIKPVAVLGLGRSARITAYGRLRVKLGTPPSDTDGSVVGTQN